MEIQVKRGNNKERNNSSFRKVKTIIKKRKKNSSRKQLKFSKSLEKGINKRGTW